MTSKTNNSQFLDAVVIAPSLCMFLIVASSESNADEMNSSLGVSIVAENIYEIQNSSNIDLLDDLVNYYSNAAGLSDIPKVLIKSNINTFYAVPQCQSYSYPTLVVDLNFYQFILSSGIASLEYVVAHEIGHFMQFEANSELSSAICNSNDVPVKTLELMADTVAGWLIGKAYNGSAPQNLLYIISSLADYEFANIRHHGTVSERSSAFGLGLQINRYRNDISIEHLINNEDRYLDSIFFGNPNPDPAVQNQIFETNIEELYR